jgi:YegS/Rv2252/BmrU family lipid kinase
VRWLGLGPRLGRQIDPVRNHAHVACAEPACRFGNRRRHTDHDARAAQDGADLLVVVGGDGSVHEVVNGLAGAGLGEDVELALLARGTGKDVARSLRVPRSLDPALEVAQNGVAKPFDVGRAHFRGNDGQEATAYFLNFAGAGISGAIAERANHSSKALGGRVSFMWATIAVFARWRTTPMTIRVDGVERSGRMLEVLAMNGDYTAGGMWIAPGAKPDDGVLDVVVMGDVTKLDFLVAFPRIYRGTHLSHPKIDLLHGSTIEVDGERALPVVLDGEQPGTTPARFEIAPAKLRVRVPASG